MNNILSTIARDSEGFLLDLNAWQPTVAEAIAAEDNLILTQPHWEIIYVLREFYQEYNTSPAMRALLKILADKNISTKIDSLYLQALFPQGPAKQANKIAGLPKPIRCI